MRRAASSSELNSRARTLSPCWLPAAGLGSVVPDEAGSFRFQQEMDSSPGLSAAALRLALASAGAEELRVVHEMRECGADDSGLQSAFSLPAAGGRQPQQSQDTPLLTKQLSLQHHSNHRHDQNHHHQPQQQQQRVQLQGRFRSATADSAAADNPVRAALNRAFPASPTACSAATAARDAGAFSTDDLKAHGQQWKPSAASAAPMPAAGAAAQAGRLLSDASSLMTRSCGTGGGVMAPSAFAFVPSARLTWPARRARRTRNSSGGSFHISASDAGSMSISAEGSSSGRSSFDRTSSQGRTSFDGENSSSDASERSERCAAPPAVAALRAESMPSAPHAPYPGCASPKAQAHSAAPGGTHGALHARQGPVSSHGSGAPHGAELGSSLSRRDASLMDADCCGDSGCAMPLSRRASAARAPSLPCDRLLAAAGSSGAPLQRAASSSDALAVLLEKEASIGTDKPHKWACMSDGQAAVQLFYRLNHARQTVDFVRRQRAAFNRLNKARMTILEALATLDTLREYETALLGEEGAAAARDLGLAEHAFQTAEACRLAHPDAEWLQLAGLLHGLGKLLAHPTFGSEAQWAVCGESFPVGCQHSANITAAEYFSVNPDRRRRMYNTPTGMYARNCGLGSVMMSWSGAEYLHLVLTGNRGCALPAATLWLLRHAKFRTLPAGDYDQLLDGFDRLMVPSLAEFQELSAFKRQQLPGRLHGAELREHYTALLAKYLPAGPLRW